MPENLEIKLRVRDPDDLERTVKALWRCVFDGWQRDTYFRVPRGRLKLRETPEGSELILYLRPNKTGARWSTYLIAGTNQPRRLKQLLTALFGVKQIVSKRRKVFLHRNARIHLDRVERLGNFVEIEVMRSRGRKEARDVLSSLLQKLRIDGEKPIGGSYSDLLTPKDL